MGKLVRWAAVAAVLAALGGCVYAPPPPAYGYAPGYAYPAAPYSYYYGPPVAVGVGVGYCCGWHHWR